MCSFINGTNKVNNTFWKLEDKKLKALAVVERAKKLYGEDSDYDFSLITEVENTRTTVNVIHKRLGVISMDVHRLLSNTDLDKDGKKKTQVTKHWSFQEFENKLKELNDDRLIVKESDFKNLRTPMKVTCVEHGEFTIEPSLLLKGTKCPICEFLYDLRKKDQAFWMLIPPEKKAKYVIEKFRQVHGNRYIYDRIKSVNSIRDYVEIGCDKHGYFNQTIACHLSGQGCPECNRNKIPNEVVFEEIDKALGGKYNMKEGFEYRTVVQKIPFICPDHGEFELTFKSIQNGAKCPVCDFLEGNTHSGSIWRTGKYTPQDMARFVVERLKKLYDDRFGYERITEVYSMDDMVDLICPIHGPFTKTIRQHLEGRGCPDCNGVSTITSEDLNRRVHELFGNKYGDNLVYTKLSDNIHLICPIHGEFDINIKSLLSGSECHICDFITNKRGINHVFWEKITPQQRAQGCIERANIVHNNKYKYHLITEVYHESDMVKIVCPKHGVFVQRIGSHLRGNGCPYCLESKLEANTEELLKANNINYIKQYSPEWLGKQSIDFYLPVQNISIECQGRQHFEYDDFFKHDDFDRRKNNDIKKYNLMKEHGIPLYYLFPPEKVSTDRVNSIQEIYTEDNSFYTMEELIHKIREGS